MPTADEFSFLPEKNNMRDYTEKNEYFDRVKHTYFSMHANQTYEYVQTQVNILYVTLVSFAYIRAASEKYLKLFKYT